MTTATPAKTLFADLKKPFHTKHVEWKLGNGTDKSKGRPLPYLKFKAVADRLDEVLGEQNWKSDYVAGPAGGVVCRLSVRIDKEWITKENGADNPSFEGVKGGLTDAFKRAATMWGVGRYLHDYEAIWVDIDEQRRYTVPALGDSFLCEEELAEIAAREKEASDAIASARATEESTSPAAAKPATPNKVAPKASQVGTLKSAEDRNAVESVAVAAVPVAAPAPADVAVVAEAAVTLSPEVASKPEAVKEPAAQPAPLVVAPTAEQEDTTIAAAAEAEVAEVSKPEVAPAATATVSPPANDIPAAAAASPADGTGAPAYPAGLDEIQQRRVAQLQERIATGAPSAVVREYLNGDKCKASLAPAARDYVFALLEARERGGTSAIAA